MQAGTRSSWIAFDWPRGGSVPKVVVYDKAKWHYESDNYPDDLADTQAFVHTGLFLGWLVANGCMSVQWLADFPDLLTAFAARKKTGPNLFRIMGGSLTSEDLSAEGNGFARAYFDFDAGVYLDDYEKLLAAELPSMYHVADTWQNFDKLSVVVDKRLRQWRRGKLPPHEGR
jgi:hypothetical protein